MDRYLGKYLMPERMRWRAHCHSICKQNIAISSDKRGFRLRILGGVHKALSAPLAKYWGCSCTHCTHDTYAYGLCSREPCNFLQHSQQNNFVKRRLCVLPFHHPIVPITMLLCSSQSQPPPPPDRRRGRTLTAAPTSGRCRNEHLSAGAEVIKISGKPI